MTSKTLSLSLALALSGIGLKAQSVAEPNLSPIVQQTTFGNNTLQAPEAFQLKLDAKRQNTYPITNLKKWLRLSDSHNKGKGYTLPLSVGVRGDKSIRAVEKYIPSVSEGYYLAVSEKGITIAGADERGLFYGLQTLRQMLQDGKLALGTITDYPDVPYRGVVEGFYGTPWSYEDRLSQLDFYGRNKLNVYIYGPKDDPYHSVPNWRKPYPETEAKQIQSLVERARDNGVIFYWAIHPGQDIKWNEDDRSALIAKFEAMYQLGVRGFAVFFDDISGEGTKADKQAELLNYLDEKFVQAKGDVAPLIMCPTEYNKSWSNIEKGYLPTLGDKLNKGIEIMWTGNTVVACLDKPDVEWINKHIKRKAYIWFNFPVSDFVRDHLLLGETYGNSLEIADKVSGFLSNPMEHAESSKIALYSIADYTWNMRAYDAHASWLRAMEEVFPEAPDALLTFASHSSALGANGHRFEREESQALQATLKALKDGRASQQEKQTIAEECRAIVRACNRLLASSTNPNMIDEMRPWLTMAKLVGEYGQTIMAMHVEDLDGFRSDFFQVKALQRLMYLLDTEVNQNPYQPGVKYASQHLLPALNAHLARLVEQFNKTTRENLVIEEAYKPFELTSSLSQLKHQPINTRGKQVSVSPSNEMLEWQQGSSLTLTAKENESLQSLSLNLGAKDLVSKLRLELEIGGKWQAVELQQNANDPNISAKLKGFDTQKLSRIRLVYIGSEPSTLKLNRFSFTLR